MRPTSPAAADSQPTPSPRELGPTAPDELVHFNVSLRLPGAADLDTFLDRLTDPKSSDYHDYLSPTEFGERFGLPLEAIDRVLAWLTSGGLEASVVPQRTSVAVTGSAAQVNLLLGVGLMDWQNANGDRFHRPSAPVGVRDELGADVAAVLGLDTEPVMRPALVRTLIGDVPPGGLLPDTVSRAYEIESLHADGFRGEGQSIAIISFDTFTPSDIDVFDEHVGITGPPVENVRLPGARETPGDDAGEVALDIEVIRGIAPQATIINYEGPNSLDNLGAIIARIVADGRAQIISDSWGLCEKHVGGTVMAAGERELAAAFAAGLSMFAASGDNAAYDCRDVRVSNDPFERDLTPGVQWPASSPSVLGVGGTFLWLREDGTYYDEAGWEEPLSGNGGGGGLSTHHDRPSWQQGPGVDNPFSNGMRQVPDVAGPADPATGFKIIYTKPGDGRRVSGQVGGTSAAAPFWSASMLLTRQLAASEGVTAFGPLGPVLYQIAAEQPPGAVFHDVIRGGNLLYDAGSGWDYSTGLGTPRVAGLARAIVDFLKR
jgi:subtilase family serine protease